MNNTGKIITAVAAGAAVGAVLGILFAPDKGSETRKKINDQGRKVAGDLKNQFEKVKGKFNDLKTDIRQKVNETAEEFA
ncbi:MAG: YtxH domain-containing protein [Chitinophagaceae bacterium]|nr:YtxH domain-containing protein [Chitinophagaceae bacterium]